MKKIIIAFLMLLPLMAYSQKIEKNEVDEFTKKKVISTNWEKLKNGNSLTGENYLYFKVTSINEALAFHLKWITNEMLSITEGSELMFKLSNDSIISLSALDSKIAGKGEGSPGFLMSGILGINNIYTGSDILSLAGDAITTKLRIYTTGGYVDLEIKESDAKKINKAFKLIQNAK